MRTIEEIKATMTDSVLANATLRESLHLDPNQTWNAQVSSVSVLNLMIYIVAVAHHTVEWLFDQFRGQVEERIAAAMPGTVAWYWNRATEYQDDEAANVYFSQNGHYETIDESKRIIKFAAVVEEYNMVKVKVNKTGYAPLTTIQLDQFTAYMERLKFAGVRLSVSSMQSDDLSLSLHIWRDRLLLTGDNNSIVAEAVSDYLNGIVYGGIFNKTSLIDRLQKIPGVIDAVVDSCVFAAHDGGGTITDVEGQNYKSIAGHISLKSLTVDYE